MRLDPSEADARAGLFGGQGTVRVWDLLRGRSADPFTAVLWCELEPGGSVGTHVQQEHPEIVVCVEGEGVATVENVEHALVPGAVVHLPYGQRLAIRNGSQAAPLAYLIIKAFRDRR